TQTKRAGNGRIDFDVVFRGDLARHVPVGKLVHVKTDDIHAGRGQLSVEQIGFQKVFEQNVGAAAIGELRQNRGDLQTFFLRAECRRDKQCVSPGRKGRSSREAPDLTDELSASERRGRKGRCRIVRWSFD